MNGQETEAKFYVKDIKKIETRLQELRARLIQPRVLEQNIRFDRPDGGLRAEGRVLRLRQDTQARLTYKGASLLDEGILSRREIEFSVESFELARQFLEELGYKKLVYYEKFRTTFEIADAHVMLDEMPYGDFVEIEGESHPVIRSVAEKLGLNWQTAIGTSYLALFEIVRERLKLEIDDLNFENFKKIRITSTDLGVRPAEE